MKKIPLTNIIYNKNQYKKVIDTGFNQLIQPQQTSSIVPPSISIAEFFQNYQQLFFEIPKFGNTDSHEYLIKTSQEYVGSPITDNDLIQALIDEINQLRQENLSLQQFNTGSI